VSGSRWRQVLGTALLAFVLPAWAEGLACPPEPAPLAAEQVQKGQREALDRGFLWSIKQGGRTSWLYGTVHVARLAWMFPGPAVMTALNASRTVALELDMLDPDIARRLTAAVLAPESQPPLPAPLARRLAQQAEAMCAGPGLAPLRPEMQAMTLVALAGRRLGLEPAYGIDGFLAGMARGLGKRVISLETPESQIALLLQPTRTANEELIATTLDELENGRALRTMQRLAEAWGAGRLDELASYAQWCDCLNTAEQRAFQRRLIDERNLVLADKVAALHRGSGPVFAAVGALHMTGPEGLPALLAARGFEVERVPSSAPLGFTR
jgi:uncharacterized protein YbaP (TraB family)